MSLLRRMMMANWGEIEMREVLVNETLYNGTIPANSKKGTLNTGITWEKLKNYKRFVVTIKGASNVALSNVYVDIGGRYLARFTGSGLYLEAKNNGELLEPFSFLGNTTQVFTPGISDGSIPAYLTLIRGRYFFDLANIQDDHEIVIDYPATTIDYEVAIYGLTKEE